MPKFIKTVQRKLQDGSIVELKIWQHIRPPARCAFVHQSDYTTFLYLVRNKNGTIGVSESPENDPAELTMDDMDAIKVLMSNMVDASFDLYDASICGFANAERKRAYKQAVDRRREDDAVYTKFYKDQEQAEEEFKQWEMQNANLLDLIKQEDEIVQLQNKLDQAKSRRIILQERIKCQESSRTEG